MRLTRRQVARLALVRIALDDAVVREIVTSGGDVWTSVVDSDPVSLAAAQGEPDPVWLSDFRIAVDAALREVGSI
ncbi:hypothetical protein [Gordonia sp. MP11Mi]|uniref:Uncharacterized protein n=1 Tax=Gordonia sp. MP11Mi TaxID=3022769 RepID=A0AA97CWV7_9ACTN